MGLNRLVSLSRVTLGHFPVGLENVLDGVPKLRLSMADRFGSTLTGSPPSGEVHPIIIPHSVPIIHMRQESAPDAAGPLEYTRLARNLLGRRAANRNYAGRLEQAARELWQQESVGGSTPTSRNSTSNRS